MSSSLKRSATRDVGGPVGVWAFSVRLDALENQRLRSYLSPEEQLRVSTLRKPADKARYIVAHAGLRLVLARAFGLDYGSQPLEYSSTGKPRLVQSEGSPLIYLNLSHSGDMALVATSTDAEIGVDIEKMERPLDLAFAEAFCSRAELRWLESLPARQLSCGCYRLWTIKEAVTKALGSGLACPIKEISVDLSSPTPSVDSLGAGTKWFVQELGSWPHYAAAVACQIVPQELRCVDMAFDSSCGL